MTSDSQHLILTNIGLSFPENAIKHIVDLLVELEEALLKLMSNHGVLNSARLYLRTVFTLSACVKRSHINSNAHRIIALSMCLLQ